MPATNKKKVETAVLERERVRGAQTTLLRIYVCVCVFVCKERIFACAEISAFWRGIGNGKREKECRRVLCMCVCEKRLW